VLSRVWAARITVKFFLGGHKGVSKSGIIIMRLEEDWPWVD
jgi:hypothetical protein